MTFCHWCTNLHVSGLNVSGSSQYLMSWCSALKGKKTWVPLGMVEPSLKVVVLVHRSCCRMTLCILNNSIRHTGIIIHWSRRVHSKSFLDNIVQIGDLLTGFIECGTLGPYKMYVCDQCTCKLYAPIILWSNSLVCHQSSHQSQTAASLGHHGGLLRDK